MESDLGLVHIYWGDGKGKTTSALGTALRSLHNNYNVHLVQFMKNPNEISSEVSALAKFPNFSYKTFGTKLSFKITEKDIEQTKLAMSHLKSSLKENHDLIIADEILYALQLSLLHEIDIINVINEKPKNTELILTGSHVSFPDLFEKADLVSEIKKHKHPFDLNVKARKGIEF